VIEKIKNIEELEALNDFKEIINILIEKNNKLEIELKDLNDKNFSEEMENEAIMNKLIEIFKNIFGRKDEKLKKASDDIESKTQEINELKETEKKLDKEIETKEKQIETLNIEHMQEKIKFEKNIEELNKEKTKLNEDINTLSGKYKELEKSNNELIKDKKEKEIKTEKLMKEYEKVKQERDSMGDLLVARRLYNEYLEMNTEVKLKFKNILFQKDFESFLSSCYSTSTMDNIWDIVKVEYKNIPSENLEKLREIFKFFIIQMNKKFKDPNFALIEATLEEEFDPVTQFDLSQNSRGKIAEFIFYGYGTLEDKANPEDEDIIDKIKKRPLVLTK